MFKMFLMWFIDFLRVTIGNYRNKRKGLDVSLDTPIEEKSLLLFPSSENALWRVAQPKQSTRIKRRSMRKGKLKLKKGKRK